MKKTTQGMKVLWIILLIKGLIIATCCADIREEAILNRHIAEGKSIAGVNVGDHESDIYKAVGFPDQLDSDASADVVGKGLKVLLYSLGEGGVLIITTRYQRVQSLLLFGNPENPLRSTYRGKTTKGIGIGDSVDSMKVKYGIPEHVPKNGENMYWYEKEGIAFGVDKKEAIITVLVVAPNTRYEDYMRMKP